MRLFYKIALISSITILPSISFSQLVTTPITAPNAVNNVLVSGGLTVSNISMQGSAQQIAEFNAPNTNLGMQHGVVLSTGAITGPNVLANGTQGSAGTPGYPLLGGNTNNAAVLQFDFVPASDTLKFEYIFASMEYTSYTCSNFNDVFSFFITGPNPTGGSYANYNIALIPGTTTPVTINTVNCGQPSSPFTNVCTPAGLSNSQYFVQSCPASASQNQGVGFNGFTVPLTAVAPVVPCSTYTLIMAVADVSDGALNSAVFLKANSFGTGAVEIEPTYNYSSSINDTLIYEGCSDVTLNFVRDGIIGQADTVPVAISGSATNGVDYTYLGGAFPTQIIFAPGQSTIQLTLTPVADTFIEGPENVTFTITNINACGDTVISDVTFIITDVQPMNIDAGPDRIVCPGINQTFVPVVTGGVPPYQQTYWFLNTPGNPLGTSLINYTITQGGNYIYTATNGCNTSEVVYDTVVVTVSPPQFELAFDVDSVSCFNTGDGAINLTVTGQTPPFTYTWTPGNIHTQDLLNLDAGSYSVTVVDTFGCTITEAVSVFEPTNIPMNFIDRFVCAGDSVQFNPGPVAGVTYMWTPSQYFTTPASASPIFSSPNAGPQVNQINVTVLATAPGACGVDSFNVYVAPLPPLSVGFLGLDTTYICYNDSITLAISSAIDNADFPPITGHLWSTGATTPSIIVSAPILYWYEQTNNAGCKSRDSIQLLPVGPPVVYMDSVRYICGNEYIDLYALASTYSSLDTLTWSTGATTDSISVNTAGTYTLIVKNGCGSDTVSTEVVQIPIVTPSALYNIVTPNGDQVNDVYDVGDIFLYSEIFNAQIHNRWGTKVFETENKHVNWSPKNLSDGVYFMTIIYTDCNKKQQKLSQTITVITK